MSNHVHYAFEFGHGQHVAELQIQYEIEPHRAASLIDPPEGGVLPTGVTIVCLHTDSRNGERRKTEFAGAALNTARCNAIVKLFLEQVGLNDPRILQLCADDAAAQDEEARERYAPIGSRR